MSDQKLQEAQEKYVEAKAWGQDHARRADQLGRDLKAAQDAAESAAATAAELAACQHALAASEARVTELVGEVAAADKRAKKNEAKAENYDIIKSALGL